MISGNLVTFRRGSRTTTMSLKDYEARKSSMRIGLRITSDTRYKETSPEEVLFGPAFRDLPNTAEANYSPETGEYPHPKHWKHDNA